MYSQIHNSFEFDRFQLNVTERQLLASGEHIALSPKAFDTLVVLIRKNGKLVTKDEILKEVWRDTFVEESNLSNNIYVLRKALGEDPSGHGYIETVPRHGYRFVGEVREVSEGNSAPVLYPFENADVVVMQADTERKIVEVNEILYTELAGSSITSIKLPRSSGGKVELYAALMFALFVICCGLYWVSNNTRSSVASPTISSIAVLPFKAIGNEHRDEHFGIGITDATITKLSSLQQLAVRPTSAVFKYADRSYDALTAGSELGVDAVLEGTVQRSGDKVRVTVQLINITEGKPVWAERFDETFTDIFTVQDAISAHVADALQVRLIADEVKRFAKRHANSSFDF